MVMLTLPDLPGFSLLAVGEQDAFARESYERAQRAVQDGSFKKEIAVVEPDDHVARLHLVPQHYVRAERARERGHRRVLVRAALAARARRLLRAPVHTRGQLAERRVEVGPAVRARHRLRAAGRWDAPPSRSRWRSPHRRYPSPEIHAAARSSRA